MDFGKTQIGNMTLSSTRKAVCLLLRYQRKRGLLC